MRKYFGLLCAAALMLPVGVIAASPASGAAATPTCGAASGTATFTPPVPLASAPKVKSKLSSSGGVSKCAGGGVTGGHTVFKQTSTPTPGNCGTLVSPDPNSKGSIGTLTITWSNNKGKSVATAFKVKQTNATTATTTGKITSGLFKGKSITGTVSFKIPTDGSCTSKPLKSVKYTNKSGTKFVIK